MGMCFACCELPGRSQPNSPDPETRRKQMAEAAELRMKAQEGRGVKDPHKVKEQQRKKAELDRLEAQSGGSSAQGGLRWQVG